MHLRMQLRIQMNLLQKNKKKNPKGFNYQRKIFMQSHCKQGLKSTDTWGQLVSTILNHKTCINTSRQVLEKTLFAINAIFPQDNNLSKPKVEGSLQKTNATCSKCKTNLILTYLRRSRRHLSSQSQNGSQRSCQIRTNFLQTYHPVVD